MNISLSNWWSWGILLLLLMIVAVVDSRKRIPRKISIFILVPLLSVVIIFMMSENSKEAEQSFHTLEEAVTAYDDRSDVVATLRGKTSALVIMDDGDAMDSQIFEKTESGWKLPEDSEFQDTKRFTGDRIIVDVSTVAVDGEWYVVVSPYPGIKSPIRNESLLSSICLSKVSTCFLNGSSLSFHQPRWQEKKSISFPFE